jgi:aminopeptidase N
MRPALAVACVPLLLLATARVVRAAPPLDATTRDYDQVHLAIHVTPHMAEKSVDAETTVRFVSMADPLKDLRLHCEETDVLWARSASGAPLTFRVDGGVLTVALEPALPRGQTAEVVVRTRSKPTQGLYFHAPCPACPSTPLEMYSQGEGTDNRRWFPCYDEPDDRSTCEVFATVAKDLKTVSNGTLVGSQDVGPDLREDHWACEQRIPSYLVSLIVGRFETVKDAWKDVPLEYNGQVGRAEEIKTGFASTPAIMEFFSEYTGRKFPYPRYAQTTVWDFVYGGMENAGATTMNMRLLHTPEAAPNYSPDGLVAHEMAHQWFGDLMTCRTWPHIWLNEGFATYFTDLFFEHRDGKDRLAVERRGQNRGYMEKAPHPESLNLKKDPRGDVPVELDTEGKQYDRGAAILHQLRIELGDDVFREGIRRYVKENEDRAVVSEDLRRSMEAVAGRDLSWFFDEWVYAPGYPVLAVSWKAEKGWDGKPVARVVVDQQQPDGGGQPREFRITVPVRFGAGANATTARLDVRRRHQRFDVLVGEAAPSFLRFGDGGGTFAKVNLEQSLEQWSSALRSDTDVAGRMDAAEALAEWPDAAPAVLAKALAEDASYAVRRAAAETLGRLPGPTSLRALVDGLKDADARVREACADALGDRTRDEAGAVLSSVATKDPSPYVRAAAAKGLGALHVEGAFEALSALLKVDSHREIVRASALEGLRALRDPRAIPLAKPLLAYDWPRGDQHKMRQAALDLILALAPDEPDTQAVVVSLLDDEFHRMRAWAAEAAGKFKVRKAKERLEKMAASDPDGGTKGAAKTALERLK